MSTIGHGGDCGMGDTCSACGAVLTSSFKNLLKAQAEIYVLK